MAFEYLIAMNLKQILSENISRRRKKLGLTQAALAERLHLSPEAMTRIEKGHMSPKLSRLESIARNLQCTVPDLFRPFEQARSSRTEIIEEALHGLPEETQDALINLLVSSSRILKSQMDKT